MDPPVVCILTADPGFAARMQAAVERLGAEVRVIRPGDDMPDAAATVTDGARQAADCVLPADASDRELATIAPLLIEVARLRSALTLERASSRRLRATAALDPLTALPHRGTWDDELARRWQRAAGAGRCLALFDLDRFKRLNDEQGHAAGDAALRAAAAAMRTGIRGGDLAARVGGDEFAVLLINVTRNQAGAIVERLRQAICTTLPASAGYHWVPADSTEEPGTVQAQADDALRVAKAQGRNRSIAAQ